MRSYWKSAWDDVWINKLSDVRITCPFLFYLRFTGGADKCDSSASFDISSVFYPVKTPGAELSLPRADHPCVHSLGTFIRHLSRPWRCHWLGQTGALSIGDLLSSRERSNVALVSFDVVFSWAPTPTQLQPFCLSCCPLNLFNLWVSPSISRLQPHSNPCLPPFSP